MSTSKADQQRDPRGHSVRVYSTVYDSAAFRSLSPHDVLAYLALLRELKGYNNGDLSLPLSRAAKCGISHPKTLARSLRALCAVGLVAVARKGGCTKGGQRLPTLYRVTDRECYDIPAKYLTAMKESHEWKRVTSVQHGHDLIKAAEDAAKTDANKLKSLGHAVPVTMAPREVVRVKAMARREPWDDGLGHLVNMAENPAKPLSMRVAATFSQNTENAVHRARHSTPLYNYQSIAQIERHGAYQRLSGRPAGFFTNMIH